MANIVTKMLVGGMAMLSSLPLQMGSASAQSFELYLGEGRRPPPRYYEDYRPGPPPRYRGCSSSEAIETARSYGLRRGRISEINRRQIVVTGIGGRGERTYVIVANDSTCRRIG